MSARIYPAGKELIEIRWQVSDNADFLGTPEWDSDWLTLDGSDGYSDEGADSDGGLRTEDFEYGQT